jgi:predicted RNA methylase
MEPKPIVLRSPPWISAAMDDSWGFAELVLAQIGAGQRVLDVGTGTGVLAILLAKAGLDVVATDISATAVRAAQVNAARNGTSFPCYQSDLLRKVEGRFDLIAFNLPFSFGRDSFVVSIAKNLLRRVSWIRRRFRARGVPASVLQFRQKLAADLLGQAGEHLNPRGRVVLHVFRSEVEVLTRILPTGAEFKILENERLRAGATAGLLIQMA